MMIMISIPSVITATNWSIVVLHGKYAVNYLNCSPSHQWQSINILAPFSNTTCKVENNVFKEGEEFYTTDFCSKCVCRKGFSGESTEPYCRRINCPTELDYAEAIAKRCAPVYLTKTVESTLCCPATFVCRKCYYEVINYVHFILE